MGVSTLFVNGTNVGMGFIVRGPKAVETLVPPFLHSCTLEYVAAQALEHIMRCSLGPKNENPKNPELMKSYGIFLTMITFFSGMRV